MRILLCAEITCGSTRKNNNLHVELVSDAFDHTRPNDEHALERFSQPNCPSEPGNVGLGSWACSLLVECGNSGRQPPYY
jgi:hypothetical protein